MSDPLQPVSSKSIDPKTGIRPISEWGPHCGRGFVSDSRFGSGQVIKRTARSKSKPKKGKL